MNTNNAIYSHEYRIFAIVANAIHCHAIKLMNTNVATEAKRLRFASNIYFNTKFSQRIRFILNISRATFHIIKFHCLCDSIQTPFVSISHCVFALPNTLPPPTHTCTRKNNRNRCFQQQTIFIKRFIWSGCICCRSTDERPTV